MIKKHLFVLIYFLSPIMPIFVLYFANPGKYSNITLLLSMLLGTTAYTWFVNEFILIARPKFIERSFGLDKFYRFHGFMAIISVLLVFIHRTIEEDLFGDEITGQIGNVAWLIFVGIIVLTLLFMVDSILMRIKPIFVIKEFFKRFSIFKYEYQVAVHNFTVIALSIMFIHVMLTYSAKTNFPVRLVYTAYFAVGAGFYLYHRLKRFLFNKKIFVVDELRMESTNMWTVKLIPDSGKIFSYKPGQFGFFRFVRSTLKPEEHPFSITSEPSNKDYISITVKELGDFTSEIKNLKVGDNVHIDGPYGKFSYLDYPNEEGIVLIVGGVGISPALGILRYISKNDKNRKVALIWGVNTRNDLICMEEFEAMKKELKNFLFVPVMFKDDSWNGEKGVIDKTKIKSILNNYWNNISSTGFYVCGPDIMMKNVMSALKALGIKRKRIHFEKFSL